MTICRKILEFWLNKFYMGWERYDEHTFDGLRWDEVHRGDWIPLSSGTTSVPDRNKVDAVIDGVVKNRRVAAQSTAEFSKEPEKLE